MLLGLIREPLDDAAFSKLQAKAAGLRELLSGMPLRSPAPPERDIPLSNSSKMSLAYAGREADRDGRLSIERDHLLRGILMTKDATATMLTEAGFGLKAMRMSSKLSQSRRPERRTVTQSWPWKYRRRVLAAVLLLLLVVAALFLHLQN